MLQGFDEEIPEAYVERVTRKYGFKILHNKGQTIFVHPKIEFALDYKHNEVFICNIPEDCSEESLLHLFVRIPGLFKFRFYYHENETPKGFALAHYTNSASAKSAVDRLHGTKVKGHTLKVILSRTSKRLIITNINKSRVPFGDNMDDYVKRYFDLFIPYCNSICANTREGKPTIYIAEFWRFRDAESARKQLLKDRVDAFGARAFVQWYEE